jgi:DNA-binding beta-propeller fold protein YncE
MMIKGIKLTALIIMLAALAAGSCVKGDGIQESLPEIVWPQAPETPRIRFVNAVSEPADLRITRSMFKKFWAYFLGQTERTLVAPYGVETDSAGRLYVVDTFSRIVHVFDAGANAYYTFPDEKTSLASPVDIAIDESSGFIYVSDSQKGTVKIFKDGGKAFVGEIGQGVMERPTGIAVNPATSELLVVDTLSANILRYDLAGRHLKGVFGGTGPERGKFHYPTNIFVTANGRILVTDALNFRVQVFSSGGGFLKNFGSAGNGPGYFSRPKGIAADSDGNIYVVDALFDNVQIFSRQGRLLLAFGNPGHDYGQFWLPTGIFIDKNDTIYVSDSYNKRVQIFQYIKRD